MATAGVGTPRVINLDVFGEGVSPSVSSGATVAMGGADFSEVVVCVDLFRRSRVTSGERDAAVTGLEAAGRVVVCPVFFWEQVIWSKERRELK